MSMKKSVRLLWATPLVALQLACGGEATGDVTEEGTGAVEQGIYTAHAIVTCQSATMYANYSPTTGPRDPIKVLPYGDKIGIREDAGYPTWAVILDYGPDTWGYLLRSCYTRCTGVNSPVAGCF
jgi:hypothetical protein